MTKIYATVCDAPMARSGLNRGLQVVVGVTAQGFTGGYVVEGAHRVKPGARRWVNKTNATPGILYRVRITPK